MAGIPLTEIGADDTPWSTQLPPQRASLWAGALAELNPAAAEAMQVAHGAPISMALQLALDGEGELTPELVGELRIKRPELYRQRNEAFINDALAAMAADADARRASREAEAALSWQERQSRAAADAQARMASAEVARQHLRAQSQARGEW